MLKHEDSPQSHSQSAAKVRVTPEELAAAVTALQMRKEGQPETIAIGDAVDELRLDITPEEVLAEIRAGRTKKRPIYARRFVLALGIAGILLGFAVDSSILTQAQSPLLIPGMEPYHVEPGILALNPVFPESVVTTLAEAPDRKTLYCSPHAIEVAAMSRNTQEPQLEIRDPVTEMNWPVVKYGKDLYVRGWTRVPFSKEAAKLSDVEVFNKPNLPQLGTAPQQVTFKLDVHTSLCGLDYQRLNSEGVGEITFHDPRFTPHTYEKW